MVSADSHCPGRLTDESEPFVKVKEPKPNWTQLLTGCFLESVCYWIYLIYFTQAVRAVALFSASPVCAWEQPMQDAFVTFIVDYIYKRGLSADYPIDPLYGLLVRRMSYGVPVYSYREALSIGVGCLASAPVVVFLMQLTCPVPLAGWDPRTRGRSFCFSVEFFCSLIMYFRAAIFFISIERTKQLAMRMLVERSEDKDSPNVGELRSDADSKPPRAAVEFNCEQKIGVTGGSSAYKLPSHEIATEFIGITDLIGLPGALWHYYSRSSQSTSADISNRATDVVTVQIRGMYGLSSLITAAITGFGGLFTRGGPMLNPTYLLMSTLVSRDIEELFVLATAQICAAALAENYVRPMVKITKPMNNAKKTIWKCSDKKVQ